MQAIWAMTALKCTFLVVLAAAGPAASSDWREGPSHGIALNGDLKYGPDFKAFDYVNPAAPRGGELRLAASGTYNSMNPHIVKGVAAAGLWRVYDRLMTKSADEPLSLYGVLAESIHVSSDHSHVQFRLRPDARWHDKRPVTADDVIWTFHTLREKGEPHYRYYYRGVLGVKKIDERTVLFSIEKNNRELPLILAELVVLPKHWWSGREFTKTTLDPPLGSGPYRIASYKPGQHIEYRRVPDYWAQNLPAKVGHHNFGVVRYEYYRNPSISVEALKAGKYDLRWENIAKNWARAYQVPALKEGLLQKKKFPHARPVGMQAYVLNSRRVWFRDRRVREALAYAVDFAEMNRTLFFNEYRRTTSYFENSPLAARGLPSPDELAILETYRGRVPDEVFTKEYQPPSTNGPQDIRGNLLKAERLLEEAGWRVDETTGKLTHESGRVMAFEVLLLQPAFEKVANRLKVNLEALGITVHVQFAESAQYELRLSRFDFDVVIATWPQSHSPGNEQKGFWGSDAADQFGSDNLAGVKDPVVDALLEGIINARDYKSLVNHVKALDRVLLRGHWTVPQWFSGGYDRLIFWNRFEYPEFTPDDGVQIETWWVQRQKAEALNGKLRRR